MGWVMRHGMEVEWVELMDNLQIHPGHHHYLVLVPLGHQPDHQGLLEYLGPGMLV